MKKGFFLFFVFFLTTLKAEIPGYRFLLLEKNPKLSATAGAGIAQFENDFMFISNPAVLDSGKKQIYFSYNKWLAGIKYGSFSFLYPLSGMAVSVDWLYDKQTKYNDTGEDIGEFNNQEQIITLSRSISLNQFIRTGISLKFFESKLSDEKESKVSFDTGLYSLYKNFRLSAAANNIGSNSLPLTYKIAAGRQLLANVLMSGMEYEALRKGKDKLKFGLTYRINPEFSFYSGYRVWIKQKDFNDFTFGFGFNVDDFEFVYTFFPLGEIGISHQAMMSVKF